MRKKAVSPAHRRTLAEQVVQDGLCSQRALSLQLFSAEADSARKMLANLK